MKTVCVRIVVKDKKEAEMLVDDLNVELGDHLGLVTQLDIEDATEKEVEMYEKSRD